MTEGFSRSESTGDPLVPPGAQPAPVPPVSDTSRRSSGQQDTKDAAKQEASQLGQEAGQRAGEVGEQAKDTAKETAEHARQKAGETVGEARNRAQELWGQSRDEVSSQLGQQQHRLADGLRSFSGELGSMADGSQEQGMASDLARQASSYLERAGRWLEDREPGDVLNEVTRFARRRPGAFMAVAAGLGLVAGRVARSAKDEGSPEGTRSAGPAHRATATSPTPGTTQYQPAHGTATGPATGPAGPAGAPATSGYDTTPGGGGAR